MNKFILFVGIFGMLFHLSAQAQEKTEAAPAPATLSKKDISTGMSQVWCQKMEECSTDKSMPIKECQRILFKSFKTGFDNLPKGQKLEISQPNLDECKKSIQAGTCDSLKKAQTLVGCEFISVLNR